MTKTQIAILWGLAAAVLIVFVLLSWIISRPKQGDVPVMVPVPQSYRLPAVPFSARGFYPRAEQAARSWQSDAGLVSVSASWPRAGAVRPLDGFSLPVDWTFQFTSPGTQRIYVVNVNEAAVSPIRESLAPYPLPTVSAADWRLDSFEALNAWLNGGAGAWLAAHPLADVSIRLRQAPEGALEWVIVGAAQGDAAILVGRIHAGSGQVLE
jgi:hypothetical protein